MFDVIDGLKNLHTLIFSRTFFFIDQDITPFKARPPIKKLIFETTSIQPSHLFYILHQLRDTLETLIIDHCRLDDAFDNSHRPLTKYPKLKTLIVKDSPKFSALMLDAFGYSPMENLVLTKVALPGYAVPNALLRDPAAFVKLIRVLGDGLPDLVDIELLRTRNGCPWVTFCRDFSEIEPYL